MQCQLALSRLVNSVLGLLLCLFVALGGPAVALAAPGELDASFGSGGTSSRASGGPTWPRPVVIQPDGKLVVAGRTNIAGNTVFALARYNANGGLDPAFGTGGLVTTDFGSTDQAFAVALQADGKIVTAGRRGSDVIVARYNADGTQDTLFGATNTPGRVVTNFGATEQALALVLQPDGKIVVAGRTNKPAPNGNFDFALARYEAAGTLDLTFGTLGLVTTDFGGSVDRAFAMALQPDGKLVVVGGLRRELRPRALQLRRQPRRQLRGRRQGDHDFRRDRPGLGGDPAAGRQDRRGGPDGHGHQHRLRPRPLQLRRQPRRRVRHGGRVTTNFTGHQRRPRRGGRAAVRRQDRRRRDIRRQFRLGALHPCRHPRHHLRQRRPGDDQSGR